MALFDFKKHSSEKDKKTDNTTVQSTEHNPVGTTPSPDGKNSEADKNGLFGFLKRRKVEVAENSAPNVADAPAVLPEAQKAAPTADSDKIKTNLFNRIKSGLSRTGSAIGSGIGTLLLGKRIIDAELMDELETRLLIADTGVEATARILGSLTQRVERKELTDGDALYQALQDNLHAILQPSEAPLIIPAHLAGAPKKPFVILVVGVNGAGKTTTIGKLAQRLQREGRSVLLAAGDTFRAAAVEQLQVWGERNNVTVIAQHTGADSASVIFDAVQAAQARNIDVVIADTAGRLHNKSNLMEELKKVKRVIAKLDASAPQEVLLVLDAGTGQNAISQAEQFHAAVGVTGIALTKLDGTAKGGVIFAVAQAMTAPIRFIGVGEQMEDLQVFNAREFIKALFDKVN